MADRTLDQSRLKSKAVQKRLDAYLAANKDLTPEQALAIRRYTLGEASWRASPGGGQDRGYHGGFLPPQSGSFKPSPYSDFATDLAKHVFSIRPPTALELKAYGEHPRFAGGDFQEMEAKDDHGRTVKVPAKAFGVSGLASSYWNPSTVWGGLAPAEQEAFWKEHEAEAAGQQNSESLRAAMSDMLKNSQPPSGSVMGPPGFRLAGTGGRSLNDWDQGIGPVPRSDRTPREAYRDQLGARLGDLDAATQAMRKGVTPGGIEFQNVAGVPTPLKALDSEKRDEFVGWIRDTFGQARADEYERKRPGQALSGRTALGYDLPQGEREHEGDARRARLKEQLARERGNLAGREPSAKDVLANPAGYSLREIMAAQLQRRQGEESQAERAQRERVFGDPNASVAGLQDVEDRIRRSASGQFAFTKPDLAVRDLSGLTDEQRQARYQAAGLPDPSAAWSRDARAAAQAQAGFGSQTVSEFLANASRLRQGPAAQPGATGGWAQEARAQGDLGRAALTQGQGLAAAGLPPQPPPGLSGYDLNRWRLNRAATLMGMKPSFDPPPGTVGGPGPAAGTPQGSLAQALPKLADPAASLAPQEPPPPGPGQGLAKTIPPPLARATPPAADPFGQLPTNPGPSWPNIGSNLVKFDPTLGKMTLGDDLKSNNDRMVDWIKSGLQGEPPPLLPFRETISPGDVAWLEWRDQVIKQVAARRKAQEEVRRSASSRPPWFHVMP